MVWGSVSQTTLNFSKQFLSKREALYQFSLKFGLRFLSFRDQWLSGIRLTYTEEDKNYVHVEQKNVINVCDTLKYFAYSALAGEMYNSYGSTLRSMYGYPLAVGLFILFCFHG